MGYTWEIDAHLMLKRAYVLEPAFGTRDDWADALADLLDAALAARRRTLTGAVPHWAPW